MRTRSQIPFLRQRQVELVAPGLVSGLLADIQIVSPRMGSTLHHLSSPSKGAVLTRARGVITDGKRLGIGGIFPFAFAEGATSYHKFLAVDAASLAREVRPEIGNVTNVSACTPERNILGSVPSG